MVEFATLPTSALLISANCVIPMWVVVSPVVRMMKKAVPPATDAFPPVLAGALNVEMKQEKAVRVYRKSPAPQNLGCGVEC